MFDQNSSVNRDFVPKPVDSEQLQNNELREEGISDRRNLFHERHSDGPITHQSNMNVRAHRQLRPSFLSRLFNFIFGRTYRGGEPTWERTSISRRENSRDENRLIIDNQHDSEELRLEPDHMLTSESGHAIGLLDMQKLSEFRHDPNSGVIEKIARFEEILQNGNLSNSEQQTIESYLNSLRNLAGHIDAMAELRRNLERDGTVSVIDYQIRPAITALREFLRCVSRENWNPREVEIAEADLAFLKGLIQTDSEIISPQDLLNSYHTKIHLIREQLATTNHQGVFTEILSLNSEISALLDKTNVETDPVLVKGLMDASSEVQQMIHSDRSTAAIKSLLIRLHENATAEQARRSPVLPVFNPLDPLEVKLLAIKAPDEELIQIKGSIHSIDTVLKQLYDVGPETNSWQERKLLLELKNRLEEEKELKQRPFEKAHNYLESFLLSTPPERVLLETVNRFMDLLEGHDYAGCEKAIDELACKVYQRQQSDLEPDHRMAIRQIMLSYMVENDKSLVDSIENLPDFPEFGFIAAMKNQLEVDQILTGNVEKLLKLGGNSKLNKSREILSLVPFEELSAKDQLEQANIILFQLQRLQERMEYRLTADVKADIKKAAEYIGDPNVQPQWLQDILAREDLEKVKEIRQIQQKIHRATGTVSE